MYKEAIAYFAKDKIGELTDEHFKTEDKSNVKEIVVGAVVTAVVGEILTGGLATPLFLTVGVCAVAGYFIGKKVDEVVNKEKTEEVTDICNKIKSDNKVVAEEKQTQSNALAYSR